MMMPHPSTTRTSQGNYSSVIDDINKELKQKGHVVGSPEEGGMNESMEEGEGGLHLHLPTNHQLITEMRTQNFDVIRFATYRTACKLRFVQKRTNLYLVDIWNVIEAFRECGLASLEGQTEVQASMLWTILTTIFRTLNKRLPNSAQISVEDSVTLLYNLLVSTYDTHGSDILKVLSIKASLSILCAGKLVDKMRYAFSLVSDTNGELVEGKLDAYLHEVLALPTAVYEGLSFEYSEHAVRACFDHRMNEVKITEFIETMTSEPGPECIMWLPILHRLATVENVHHPVQCEACKRESFSGFRYKCQRCYNYHLCQECFWYGKTSGNHNNEHEVKEYAFYKSPVKQLEHSLKKSMRCVPSARSPSMRSNGSSGNIGAVGVNNSNTASGGNSVRGSRNRIDSPERTGLNQSSASVGHVGSRGQGMEGGVNGYHGYNENRVGVARMRSTSPGRSASLDRAALKSNTLPPSYHCKKQSPSMAEAVPAVPSSELGRGSDDEHRLIARYTARLAADVVNSARSPGELCYSSDANKAQRELVAQLEQKNRDIMREIYRLRQEQQEAQAQCSSERTNAGQQRNPMLVNELKLLRQRRDELESRMTALQDSRNELMVQLESLMKLLKASGSPRFSRGSLPRVPPGSSPLPRRPSAARRSSNGRRAGGDSLDVTGDNIVEAFVGRRESDCQSTALSNMRNHLFVAADSVTDAMSSLVKELNSEVSSGSEDELDNGFNTGGGKTDDEAVDDFLLWQREMQDRLLQERQFLDELQKHRFISSDGTRSSSRGFRTNDSFNKTEDEMNPRTDDDDNELYDKDPKELSRARVGGRVLTSSRRGQLEDDSSCHETDQESYIRTDDEDMTGSNEWEDAAKRWINR